MSCRDQHGTGCQCTAVTDTEIVNQIDLVKAAMFRLEEMVSNDLDNPQRRDLYRVRVEFCTTAFAVIGRRKQAVPL